MNTDFGQVVRVASRLGLIGSVLALAVALPGCTGYVEGGGDAFYEPPDYYWLDGTYFDGRYAREYGDRGERSRIPADRRGTVPPPTADRAGEQRRAPAPPAAPPVPGVRREHDGDKR